MERLDFDDIELTYELRGRGEPIVLPHASAFVRWYEPLIDHLPQFSTLRYRRRVERDSSGGFRPFTIAEDAAICRRLIDHVGWRTAHVVGHSYGALVALQLAADEPTRIRSVALLEPAARGIAVSEEVVSRFQRVVAAYELGDNEAAMDGFLRSGCGDDYRSVLDRVVPEAFDDAVAEADLFFQMESGAVQRWSFEPSDAQRIVQPVLNVVGTQTAPRFVELSNRVQSWFPHAERLAVPDAGHLLMVQNPQFVAGGVASFVSRHPIGDAQQPGH